LEKKPEKIAEKSDYDAVLLEMGMYKLQIVWYNNDV